MDIEYIEYIDNSCLLVSIFFIFIKNIDNYVILDISIFSDIQKHYRPHFFSPIGFRDREFYCTDNHLRDEHWSMES